MVIVVEVVDNLTMFDVSKVDITSLSGPFQIKKLRIDILVLKPAFII